MQGITKLPSGDKPRDAAPLDMVVAPEYERLAREFGHQGAGIGLADVAHLTAGRRADRVAGRLRMTREMAGGQVPRVPPARSGDVFHVVPPVHRLSKEITSG